MKVYIIYRLGDYAVPQAMSLNYDEAKKFMKVLQDHDPYMHEYWIESKTLNNGVIEI